MTSLITEPPAQWLQDIMNDMADEQIGNTMASYNDTLAAQHNRRKETMPQLIHIAVSPAPSGGTAYFGMKHVPDYREDITGYEIVSADTGMACDVCGYPMTECTA